MKHKTKAKTEKIDEHSKYKIYNIHNIGTSEHDR